MTNRGMAEASLAQAGEILVEARELHRRGVWSLVVRRSQEVVELSLKAALRIAGIEVPKIHDVGVLLKDHQGRFPETLRAQTDRLASISCRLRHEREVAFDGDEEAGARLSNSTPMTMPAPPWRRPARCWTCVALSCAPSPDFGRFLDPPSAPC